jgi:hypothetical protein
VHKLYSLFLDFSQATEHFVLLEECGSFAAFDNMLLGLALNKLNLTIRTLVHALNILFQFLLLKLLHKLDAFSAFLHVSCMQRFL